MAIELVQVSKCWCGSERVTPFADHYLRCEDCGTLINSPRLPDGCFSVGDGERNFYNKNYWFAYQRERHGLPDIVRRARDDLAERCLYWLDAVLRYKRPPGRSIEIGCSHGGFVALMKMAGFDAIGIELSPWVADYAAKTFDIAVRCGTLADMQIEPESVDCVILMDVLEHLRDPKATMCAVSRTLKPDGIVVIQTPCYRDNGPSWEMLIDQEHLFLFTEDSLRRLLSQVGLPHVAVNPHLFPHDMFLVAGTSPLTETSREEIDASLLGTPDRRLLLALFDLYGRLKVSPEELEQQLEAAEADRAARLVVIEEQGQRLGTLTGERNVLQAQLGALQQQLEGAEADRAARLAVIEEQGQRLGALQQQLEVVETDHAARLSALEGERHTLLIQLRALQDMLQILQRTRIYRLLHLCRRWRFIEQTVPQAPATQTRRIGSGAAVPAKNSPGGTALQVLTCLLSSIKRLTYEGIRSSGTWMRRWSTQPKTPLTDTWTSNEQLIRKYGTNECYTQYYYKILMEMYKDHPLFDVYLESELGALNRSRSILKSLCTTVKNVNLFHGKRCLDIGCSSGNSLIALTEFGCAEAIGLEISEGRFNTALININGCSKIQKKKIRIYHGSIFDKEIIGRLGLFDVIFCLDVLEHVDSPELTIKNIKELLKNREESFAFLQLANKLHYENIMHEPHYNIPGLILLNPLQAVEYYNACRIDYHFDYEVNQWLNLDEFEKICKENDLSCENFVGFDCRDNTVDMIENNLPQIKTRLDAYISNKRLDYRLRSSVCQAVDDYIENVVEEIAKYRISKNPEQLFRLCLKYSVKSYNFILRCRS